MQNLGDDLNTEVSLGMVKKPEDALRLIKKSFLFVRILKGGNNKENKKPEKFFEEKINEMLKKLKNIGLVLDNGINGENELRSSYGAYEIAKQCISIESLEKILSCNNNKAKTISQLLEIVSEAKEFNRVVSRLNHRDSLKALNKKIEFSLSTSPCTSSRKVYVLLQAHYLRLSLPQGELRAEAQDIAITARRILLCLFKIFIQKGEASSAKRSLKLSVQVLRRATENDFESQLEQIKNLPKCSIRAILGNKISSLEELLRQENQYLRQVTGTKNDLDKFKKVKRALQCLPKTNLKFRIFKEENCKSLELEIRLEKRCQHINHQKHHLIVSTESGKILFNSCVIPKFSPEKNFEIKKFTIKVQKLPLIINLESYSYIGLSLEYKVDDSYLNKKFEQTTPFRTIKAEEKGAGCLDSFLKPKNKKEEFSEEKKNLNKLTDKNLKQERTTAFKKKIKNVEVKLSKGTLNELEFLLDNLEKKKIDPLESGVKECREKKSSLKEAQNRYESIFETGPAPFSFMNYFEENPSIKKRAFKDNKVVEKRRGNFEQRLKMRGKESLEKLNSVKMMKKLFF